jgi:hypothetical protein
MRSLSGSAAMLILIALLNASLARGNTVGTPKCKAARWPFSRVQSKRELIKQMEELDRSALVEYFFGELTLPETKQNVANSLALYLAQTETNLDLRSFYKFLETGANLRAPKDQWRKLKLREVCEVYAKVLAADK